MRNVANAVFLKVQTIFLYEYILRELLMNCLSPLKVVLRHFVARKGSLIVEILLT